ncbi:hypothetical protein DW352_11070 [Pseudolabrys taiwanensis]|uniref:Uncharacterized protein n=1 Tax=Pseudolabrys taiwanensis TaxID=331696 RepID=A0A345ZVQ6_9HYPH|nr:hypothetical protein [Pseudolabrys taiwanensis]AXK81003.1 hypothetical protein DW352_11070 [Pseudolabrys taiwanensis]
MPLHSRVSPFGELFATGARGTLMGNRGGRLHDSERKLTARRWTSKQWICCKLDFNDRHRKVWGDSYTELFFLDEVTAFAAGHRPCFECRRKDAEHFAVLFANKAKRASAADMDRVLHVERLDGKQKRLHRLAIEALPDGAMIARGGEAFAARGRHMLPWTPSGYGVPLQRPRGLVYVLTPPAILGVLTRGYRPQWHPSAA